MKTLVVWVFALMVLTVPARTYRLSPSDQLVLVGQVESREHTLGGFHDVQPTTIFAGPSDGSKIEVRIVIEDSLGYHVKRFYSKKCLASGVKEGECDDKGFFIMEDYENLKKILRKSIEWSRVAIAHRVERVSKQITLDGKDSVPSPFGTGDVRFFATSRPAHTELVFPVSISGIYGSKTLNRYYDLNAQIKFLDLLENKVPVALDKAIRDQAHFN